MFDRPPSSSSPDLTAARVLKPYNGAQILEVVDRLAAKA